jgi:hypothetical protein
VFATYTEHAQQCADAAGADLAIITEHSAARLLPGLELAPARRAREPARDLRRAPTLHPRRRHASARRAVRAGRAAVTPAGAGPIRLPTTPHLQPAASCARSTRPGPPRGARPNAAAGQGRAITTSLPLTRICDSLLLPWATTCCATPTTPDTC